MKEKKSCCNTHHKIKSDWRITSNRKVLGSNISRGTGYRNYGLRGFPQSLKTYLDTALKQATVQNFHKIFCWLHTNE